jgi:hypothetical protein
MLEQSRRTDTAIGRNAGLVIRQYQREKRNHPLFHARAIVRGWYHPGYIWAAVMDDGDVMCRVCVRDNWSLIVEAGRDPASNHGWRVVGVANASEDAAEAEHAGEPAPMCCHCGGTL